MARKSIVDAGPIIAFLNREDDFHAWAVRQFELFPKFYTCEAVIAEACARLSYGGVNPQLVVALLERGALAVDFTLSGHLSRVSSLLDKYAGMMDFADACIVTMTEAVSDCVVVTVDVDDFSTYRRHGRGTIPAVFPD